MSYEVTLRLRRDTADVWLEVNPVLAPGEPGYELDTGSFKIGDGITRWSELQYFAPAAVIPSDGAGLSDASLIAHINSKNPHPVYDDGPSLLLLYQNAKV